MRSSERPGRQVEMSAVEDKGGERLDKGLADPDRVRRVDNIRIGTREVDSAHPTTPARTRPRRFGQLPNLDVPDTVDDPLPDAEIDA